MLNIGPHTSIITNESTEDAAAARAIAALAKQGPARLISVDGITLTIPESLRTVLVLAGQILAEGNHVLVDVVQPMLTVHECATILNCGPEYVRREIEAGNLIATGTNVRCVAFADLISYKQQRDERRREALTTLIGSEG